MSSETRAASPGDPWRDPPGSPSIIRRGSPAAEPAAARGGTRAFLRLVMIEHSVFALPFAYLSALTAMAPDVQWGTLGLVTVAMVAARTFAMALNRIADRELDARNPRTARRELVTGAVPLRTAAIGTAVALVVFLVVSALLSPLCLVLAPLALVPITIYPYGKRFTWACHAILGLAQAVAPVGAWIAVTGQWSWAAVALGLGVGLWIGGFDLIYALQDVDADRANGVYSVPARFGVAAALQLSTAAHVVTFALFLLFGALAGFGGFWYVGLVVTAAAFCYEHSVVKPDDLSRVNRAFFTANGFVGIALFGFALLDLLVRGLHA